MEDGIVLYPAMGVGHLAPMVELAKLFLRDGFAVTVLVVDSPFDLGSSDAFIAAAAASAHLFLSFHHLPPVSLPPNVPANPVILMFDILRQTAAHLRPVLTSLSETSAVRALVIDFFCTDALDIAAEVDLPSYIFFSTSAASLAAALYLPILHSATSISLRDLGDALINFPGIPPIPASDMPDDLQDRNGDDCQGFLFHFDRLPRCDGILINSFESLDPRAVAALKGGVCLPGRPMPPTYCIGPLKFLNYPPSFLTAPLASISSPPSDAASLSSSLHSNALPSPVSFLTPSSFLFRHRPLPFIFFLFLSTLSSLSAMPPGFLAPTLFRRSFGSLAPILFGSQCFFFFRPR